MRVAVELREGVELLDKVLHLADGLGVGGQVLVVCLQRQGPLAERGADRGEVCVPGGERHRKSRDTYFAAGAADDGSTRGRTDAAAEGIPQAKEEPGEGPFPSLPLPLPFPSLPFLFHSLPFSSLLFPSIPFPYSSLPSPSLPFIFIFPYSSLPFPSLLFPSSSSSLLFLFSYWMLLLLLLPGLLEEPRMDKPDGSEQAVGTS